MKRFLVGMMGIGATVGFFTVKSGLNAGETEVLSKRSADDAKPIAIGECLATCKDAACLRNCTAKAQVASGPRVSTGESLDECFGKAMGDITSCAAVFLVWGADADYDIHMGFWTCVSVASQVFNQCFSDNPDLDAELAGRLRRISLNHLFNAADDDYVLFLAGKLTPHRLNVSATPDGDGTPVAGKREAPPQKTFEECAGDYDADLATCDSVCGSNTVCLAGCEGVALKKFEKWASVGPKPK